MHMPNNKGWDIGRQTRAAILLSLLVPLLACALAIVSAIQHKQKLDQVVGEGTQLVVATYELGAVFDQLMSVNEGIMAEPSPEGAKLLKARNLESSLKRETAGIVELVRHSGSDDQLGKDALGVARLIESYLEGNYARAPSQSKDSGEGMLLLAAEIRAGISQLVALGKQRLDGHDKRLSEEMQKFTMLLVFTFALGLGIALYIAFSTSTRLETRITKVRELEESLKHSQKMESIGQLSAGLAHEINSPLQYITDSTTFLGSAADLFGRFMDMYKRELLELASKHLDGEGMRALKERLEDEEEGESLGFFKEQFSGAQDTALDGLERVADLVKSMRDFSEHGESQNKVEIYLIRLVENAVSLTSNECRFVATVTVSGIDPALRVLVHPSEMVQVLVNLIMNSAQALKHMQASGQMEAGPEFGRIDISLEATHGMIEIRVKDNGPGIPDKIHAKIFDPFFTTKGIGEGTGNGLTLARKILTDLHSGDLRFESKEGMGSTFIVSIPMEGAKHPPGSQG